MKPIHPILVLSLSALAFSSAVAAPPSSAGTPAAPAADTSPAQRQKAYMERFDANGDGALDPTERAAMREARASARFDKLDTNGDGVLSRAEFKAGQKLHKRHGHKGKKAKPGKAGKQGAYRMKGKHKRLAADATTRTL